MKKLIIITLAILMIGVFALSVFAHQGKTDEYGGHNDYANGDYHYHHGYDAHYHDENGNCPYDEPKEYYEQEYPTADKWDVLEAEEQIENEDFKYFEDGKCNKDGCTITIPHGHISKEKLEEKKLLDEIESFQDDGYRLFDPLDCPIEDCEDLHRTHGHYEDEIKANENKDAEDENEDIGIKDYYDGFKLCFYGCIGAIILFIYIINKLDNRKHRKDW